jgi:hypothetical protein
LISGGMLAHKKVSFVMSWLLLLRGLTPFC